MFYKSIENDTCISTNSIRSEEGAILFMKETKVSEEQNVSKKLTASTCDGYKSKSRPVDGFELIRLREKVIGKLHGNRLEYRVVVGYTSYGVVFFLWWWGESW